MPQLYGPIFSVSCCSGGGLYVFPQLHPPAASGHALQEQKRGCSQGMTPASALCPRWHGSGGSLNPAFLQDGSRRSAEVSRVIWSVAQALSCCIRIFWLLWWQGWMLPSVTTPCLSLELLWIGAPLPELGGKRA